MYQEERKRIECFVILVIFILKTMLMNLRNQKHISRIRMNLRKSNVRKKIMNYEFTLSADL